MKPTILTAIIATSILYISCDVTYPIYDTAHPGQATISLTTDWSETNILSPPAEGYTVVAGDYSSILTGTVNTLDYLFEPGTYTVYAYNTAENINVNGTIVSVQSSGETINTLPAWFYSGARSITVQEDTHNELSVAVIQQIRQLTLVMSLTGGTANNIVSISGFLSGVAASYDMSNETHGTPTSVSLTFAMQSEGDYAGKWVATVRLLGVTGAEQKLGGTIAFAESTPGDITLDSDMTGYLSSFNSDKTEPLTLSVEFETPTEAGITASITGWTIVPDSSGTAW